MTVPNKHTAGQKSRQIDKHTVIKRGPEYDIQAGFIFLKKNKCTESVIRDARVPDLACSLTENTWKNSDYYHVVG